MLVPMNVILEHARVNRYGVGSFDVPNLETATAVLEAAQEHQSPVIIAIPGSVIGLQQFEVFVSAIRMLAEPMDIPVAMVLDHGRDYDYCVRSIRAGTTAVMFDGSDLPFEENMRITKDIVKVAHALGVSVEAEVGHVGSDDLTPEEIAKSLTEPDKAVEFVKETGVDCLAVAVGTIHGHYKGEPHIHFDLIKEIADKTGVPLVLHGGSSTGEENLQKSIEHGICKINIYSDMSKHAIDGVQSLLSANPRARMNDVLLTISNSFGTVAGNYMKMFGSAGKAGDVQVQKYRLARETVVNAVE